MRLIVTIVWCLAALLWLPWALLVVRWGVDLALGVAPAASAYFKPALLGIWPVHGWLSWGIVSWWPLGAATAMALSALGWRLYWLDLDGLLPRPPRVVLVSILIPLLAPFLMYGDARRRHAGKQAELSAEVEDTLARLGA